MSETANRRKGAALLGVTAFLLGGCGTKDGPAGSPTPTAAGDAIAISGLAYKPDALEVAAGTEVVWTNQESVGHTVTAGTPDMAGSTFDEALEAEGSAFRFTFEEAGTYPFFCRIHPNGMRGEVRVT